MKTMKSGAIILLLLPIFANAQVLVKDTTLYFDYDKHEIKKEYTAILSSLVSQLKSDPTVTVEVSGHADSQGNDAYNKKLSLKRTETVIKHFHKESVDEKRIKGYNYGSSQPIASNKTASGRSLNRRVEVKLYKAETKPESVQPVAEIEKPKRIEIDVHYNKQNFAYVDNRNRSIVHTVGQAELIMEPETFTLPERSALYKNDKVRLDFTELSEKGPMLLNRVASGKEGGVLEFSYIFCLDSITNNGHAHISKGTTVEFLIPSNYHVDGASMYYSPDHDRQNWVVLQKPKYNDFHKCFEIMMKDEGCVALAKEVKNEAPVKLHVKYSGKVKGAKFSDIPEFYYISKDKTIIVAADSVKDGEAFFTGLKNSEEGTVLGIVRTDPNNILISVDDIQVKADSHNEAHVQGHVKFKQVNHFELEKILLDLHKPSF